MPIQQFMIYFCKAAYEITMKSHLLNFGSLSGETQLKGFYAKMPIVVYYRVLNYI
jgi:hypothetical protein